MLCKHCFSSKIMQDLEHWKKEGENYSSIVPTNGRYTNKILSALCRLEITYDKNNLKFAWTLRPSLNVDYWTIITMAKTMNYNRCFCLKMLSLLDNLELTIQCLPLIRQKSCIVNAFSVWNVDECSKQMKGILYNFQSNSRIMLSQRHFKMIIVKDNLYMPWKVVPNQPWMPTKGCYTK